MNSGAGRGPPQRMVVSKSRRGAPRGRFVVRQPERLQDLASKRAQAGRRSGCRDSNPDFRTGSPAVCHSTSIRAERMYPRGRCGTASTADWSPESVPVRSHGADDEESAETTGSGQGRGPWAPSRKAHRGLAAAPKPLGVTPRKEHVRIGQRTTAPQPPRDLYRCEAKPRFTAMEARAWSGDTTSRRKVTGSSRSTWGSDAQESSGTRINSRCW